jgi:Dolichyl-phosphate-mannose-protein mannosyltransferase
MDTWALRVAATVNRRHFSTHTVSSASLYGICGVFWERNEDSGYNASVYFIHFYVRRSELLDDTVRLWTSRCPQVSLENEAWQRIMTAGRQRREPISFRVSDTPVNRGLDGSFYRTIMSCCSSIIDHMSADCARWWRAQAIDALMAVLIAAAVLAALVATSGNYALVFDEAFTVDRELTLAQWFTMVIEPPPGTSRSEFFSPEALESYWRFSRAEPDGHPPFYALLGLAGWQITQAWLDPLTSYRIGPMVLTAATCGLIYWFLAGRRGRLPGLAAALLVVFTPRTFAHAHYAHYDMPVTCLWLLAQIAFLKSLQSVRWIVVFGVLLGLAAGTKLTGWFAAVPPLCWWFLYEGIPLARGLRRRITFDGRLRVFAPVLPLRFSATRALILGIPLAALTLYAIQPAWWRAPIWGIERFLVSNLTREKSVPVTSFYLGTVYRFALPWHNTLVLTAVITPALVGALGLLGIGATLARVRSAPDELIWVLSWLVLMIVRALPNAPGHDVERLILPSLASLSILAGFGVGYLSDCLRYGRVAIVAPLVVALAMGECVLGIVQTYPYNLSYYNVAVGGLRGAERLGFDETYYCETFGPEFLDWVRQQSLREPVELFFPLGLLNIIILRHWGSFPPGVHVMNLDPATHPYHVLQRNRGIYDPKDWWLERNGHPVFTIARQGVDLLRVYAFKELEQAIAATRNEPGVLKSSVRPRWSLPR